ncbi:MAG TPA: hypothetical protein VK894_05205 [Jiangellales bacterium]|nr:hypothetical protein [Jiangellales bacterium]
MDLSTALLEALLAVLAGAAGGLLATRYVTTSALDAQRADQVRRRALQTVADQRLRLLRSAQYSSEQAALTGPAVRLRFAEGVLADVDDLPRWQAERVRELVARLVGAGWADAAATLGASPPGADAVRSHFEIQLYLRSSTGASEADAGLIGRLHDASAVESNEVARRATYVDEAVATVDELGRVLRSGSRWSRLGGR